MTAEKFAMIDDPITRHYSSSQFPRRAAGGRGVGGAAVLAHAAAEAVRMRSARNGRDEEGSL